jgi:hypothetical protein
VASAFDLYLPVETTYLPLRSAIRNGVAPLLIWTTMTYLASHHSLRTGQVSLTVGATILVWLSVLVAAWSYLMIHDLAPEAAGSGAAVSRWPDGSALQQATGRPTLLLFLHPKCPCSRAAIRQLERIDAAAPRGAANLIVVVTVPLDAATDWSTTGSVAAAEKIPNANIYLDRGGIEAARFGATTSGELMLFNTKGKRVFVGGITPSRGHEGANVGADTLAALLDDTSGASATTPAYGCRLCLPTESSPTSDSAPAFDSDL